MFAIDILRKIISELNENKFEYMIGGSHVLGIYANARTSRDIDILINIKEKDLPAFLSIFNSHAFHLNIASIKEAIKEKGMFNIISEETGYKIDFFVHRETEFFNEQFSRKQWRKIFGINAWVCSREDLIIAKLIWIQEIQSELQMRDITDLIDFSDLDKNYLTKWITKLNLKTFGLI